MAAGPPPARGSAFARGNRERGFRFPSSGGKRRVSASECGLFLKKFADIQDAVVRPRHLAEYGDHVNCCSRPLPPGAPLPSVGGRADRAGHRRRGDRLSLLDSGPRTASVIVTRDMEALHFDRRDLDHLLKLQPGSALELLAAMGRRTRVTADLLRHTASRNVNQAAKDQRTIQRAADAIAAWSGSIVFLMLHCLLFAAWIVVNMGLIPDPHVLPDPRPPRPSSQVVLGQVTSFPGSARPWRRDGDRGQRPLNVTTIPAMIEACRAGSFADVMVIGGIPGPGSGTVAII